jgi:hydroxyacylglutathione hydrolase
MLAIQRFVFNIFHENTYLIWDDQVLEAAVIDPGMYDEDEQNVFFKYVEEKKLKMNYCINTHCHIDHVLGNAFIKNKYNVPTFIPKEDRPILEILKQQSQHYGLVVTEEVSVDNYLSEEVDLELGSLVGKYLFTPGHTPGEFCIYFEDEKTLFSGDVLFRQSIGRSDLWGGNQETLLESIRTKLFTLPDDVKVYPGHESATTIGFEKKNNPYVSI